MCQVDLFYLQLQTNQKKRKESERKQATINVKNNFVFFFLLSVAHIDRNQERSFDHLLEGLQKREVLTSRNL